MTQHHLFTEKQIKSVKKQYPGLTRKQVIEAKSRKKRATESGARTRGYRTTYNVVPDGNMWKVTRYPNRKTMSKHRLKRKAVEKAKKLGKKAPLSEVKIRNKDGKIGARHTYPRWSDPYPPEG